MSDQDLQAQIDALSGRVTALEQQQPAAPPASGASADDTGLLPRGITQFDTARGEWSFQAHPGTVELITARTGSGANPGPHAKISVFAQDGTLIDSMDNGSTNLDSRASLALTGLAAGGIYKVVVERDAPGSCFIQYV
jgi:hypothetical protein